jgi:SpoVK/Ycf46/Vps4 family AAA+-type ATPase
MFVVRYETLIASYLGETAARLAQVFEHVRTHQCVLFFDEFDTIAKERGDLHETGEIKRVVSTLLLQIDRLPSYVVVITATNHPELLDRAAWRRFQVRLTLPKPSETQLEEYFQRFACSLDFSLSQGPGTLAKHMKGASFSDAASVCDDIRRKYVLGLPNPNVRALVTECLNEWRESFQATEAV